LKDRINIADDREARIAELKAQISAGTYKVSSEDVADAIINSKKV
jgi:flagellar biosynthesis anti-sigma factor FlgM